MIKKINVQTPNDAVEEAAQKAADELYDFIEQHQETIDRYNELTEKYEQLAKVAYRARGRQVRKMMSARKKMTAAQ